MVCWAKFFDDLGYPSESMTLRLHEMKSMLRDRYHLRQKSRNSCIW